MKDLTQLQTTTGVTSLRRKTPQQGEKPAVTTTETTLPSDDIALTGSKAKCPATGQLQGAGLESAAHSAMGMLPGVSKAGCPHCK